MSDDLQATFQQASHEVTQLSTVPDIPEKLRLYALYKQSTSGDCEGKRPGMLDMAGRAKYDAWEALKGISQDDAMQQYIDFVAELKAKDQG